MGNPNGAYYPSIWHTLGFKGVNAMDKAVTAALIIARREEKFGEDYKQYVDDKYIKDSEHDSREDGPIVEEDLIESSDSDDDEFGVAKLKAFEAKSAASAEISGASDDDDYYTEAIYGPPPAKKSSNATVALGDKESATEGSMTTPVPVTLAGSMVEKLLDANISDKDKDSLLRDYDATRNNDPQKPASVHSTAAADDDDDDDHTTLGSNINDAEKEEDEENDSLAGSNDDDVLAEDKEEEEDRQDLSSVEDTEDDYVDNEDTASIQEFEPESNNAKHTSKNTAGNKQSRTVTVETVTSESDDSIEPNTARSKRAAAREETSDSDFEQAPSPPKKTRAAKRAAAREETSDSDFEPAPSPPKKTRAAKRASQRTPKKNMTRSEKRASVELSDSDFEPVHSSPKKKTKVVTRSTKDDIWDESSMDDNLSLQSDTASLPCKKQPTKKQPKKKPPAKRKLQAKRKPGSRPVRIRMQVDAGTRVKRGQLRKPMEDLMRMSMPLAKSDDYNPPDDSEDEEERITMEKHYPWVINGCYTYTEQKPNDDGDNDELYFLRRPQLHFWAGSTLATERLKEAIKKGKMRMQFHSTFNDYQNALSSESAKAKPAPPLGETQETHMRID